MMGLKLHNLKYFQVMYQGLFENTKPELEPEIKAKNFLEEEES